MRGLAVLIGVGWLGFGFYALGPLTTERQFVIGGTALAAGCVLSMLVGTLLGWRHRSSSPRPARTLQPRGAADGGSAGPEEPIALRSEPPDLPP